MIADAVFLVVDAKLPARTATVAQLRALGARTVFEAADATEALALLAARRVDVAIAECDLPGMPALQLLRALRSGAPVGEIAVLMVVADGADPRVPLLRAAGADEVLARPLESEALAVVLAALAGAAATRARYKVLVVDDSPSALRQIAQDLEDDYAVLTADNGLDALALCQGDAPPDLVLLDVIMPQLDGFEVLRRLQQDPRLENIPVILVSAMTGQNFRSKGLALGAVDYLAKPVVPELLRLRVRNLARLGNRQRRLQQELERARQVARAAAKEIESVAGQLEGAPPPERIGRAKEALLDLARELGEAPAAVSPPV